jgi:primosomal protein N' (replication factor Y) (superfamily II helicase)
VFVEVALPLPVHRTFTYRVPEAERARVQLGARVLVPFGKKEKIGWIDRVVRTTELKRVKELHGVLDERPSAPLEILKLCRWISEYYIVPLGQVLRTALPAVLCDSSTDFVVLRPEGGAGDGELSELDAKLVGWLREHEGPQPVARLRRELGDRVWWPTIRRLEAAGLLTVFTEGPRSEPPVRTRRVLRLTRELPSLRERGILFARAKRQLECWEMVESLGGVAEVAHLTGRLRFSSSVLAGLVDKGLAELGTEEVARDP